MQAREIVDHDLLKLAEGTEWVAKSIDDPAIRARLLEIADDLRELAHSSLD
jgi:hypothetical protein